VDRQALNYTFSILNLGIEVVVITLPIPRLLKLQVQWWRKIEVVSIFTFGFVYVILLQALQFLELTRSEQSHCHRDYAACDHAHGALYLELHL
jgi:hypothetical protein